MQADIDLLVGRIERCVEVKPRRDHIRSFTACCPAHEDKSPSLYIDLASQGNILIKCWSGCGAIDVVEAVGLDAGALFPDDDYFHSGAGKRAPRKRGLNELDLHLEVTKMARENGLKLDDVEKARELESFLKRRAIA